jgi:hypothetical protein
MPKANNPRNIAGEGLFEALYFSQVGIQEKPGFFSTTLCASLISDCERHFVSPRHLWNSQGEQLPASLNRMNSSGCRFRLRTKSLSGKFMKNNNSG